MDVCSLTKNECLESLSDKYAAVLIDTCAFESLEDSNIYGDSGNFHFSDSRRWNIRQGILDRRWDFLYNFAQMIETKKNFYLTLPILQEFLGPDTRLYTQALSEVSSQVLPVAGRYHNSVRSFTKKKRSFVDFVWKQNASLIFTSNESDEYFSLLSESKFILDILNLSNTDYDFLLSAAAISSDRGSTAIISNDFPILYAWKELCSRKPELSERLHFYLHTSPFSFEKAFSS